jgi:hypothetical protein
MTNRIWESLNDYQIESDAKRLGYVACSAGCGRVTAWSLCTMCGGNYATHNLVGKESK